MLEVGLLVANLAVGLGLAAHMAWKAYQRSPYSWIRVTFVRGWMGQADSIYWRGDEYVRSPKNRQNQPHKETAQPS